MVNIWEKSVNDVTYSKTTYQYACVSVNYI